jgi:tyrosinase
MKLFNVMIVVLAGIVGTDKKPEEVNALAAQGLHNLKAYYSKNSLPSPKKCTLNNVAVLREWLVNAHRSNLLTLTLNRSTLSKGERRNYIAAMNCLAKRPARTPTAIAAGAKSRYDDLVVTHIQQAYTIHGTASFLIWHRYYTWAFDQMLQNKCGCKGYQPHYNWGWWANDPKGSPFFDGSDTSMSGTSSYVKERKSVCFQSTEMCYIQLQPGSGGGCVTSGPFKE